MKKFLLALSVTCFFASFSYASEETVTLYADICENREPEDTISITRAKASDKAVFSAVEKLPVLELPRKEFDQHDFNILVYKLVDNHIENLNVRTTKQDSQKVCIEIDGHIKGSNIIKAVVETKEIADARAKRRAEENLIGKSPLQTQKEIENIILKEAEILPITSTSVQGEVIRINETNDEVLNGDSLEQETISEGVAPKVIIQDSDTIIIVNEDDEKIIDELIEEDMINEPQKAKVYISSTKFFDGSTYPIYSEVLKKTFINNEYFNLTDNRKEADYIVSPHILRVKVDAINNITNRMQMVAMVEMDNIHTGTNIKEHQNRFTLLSAEDDEQKIAQNLMNTLLEKAGAIILDKIELSERKKNNVKGLPKIITPANQ